MQPNVNNVFDARCIEYMGWGQAFGEGRKVVGKLTYQF